MIFRTVRRVVFVGSALALISIGAPVVSATADPEPTLKELTAEVEKLHEEIESLTEQYNGEKIRLDEAKRSAATAKKTLDTSEADLESRRKRAMVFATNAYMTGGASGIALMNAPDPDAYMDIASTTYALQLQSGEEVVQLTKAREAAQRARASAKARQDEVGKLIKSLDKREGEIRGLIKKTESELYSQVAGQVSVAKRLSLPVVGDGKAAQAVRWALKQQLKPYVWGAEGPNSFDCSGLIMAAYATVGISIPHYTGSQWTSGTHVSREDMRPGDLVFFYNDLHHVGLYIGGGYMVHAPRTGDVVRVAAIGNRPFAGAVRIAD